MRCMCTSPPKGVLRTMSGEPIALHCLAEGIPTPRIHWTIPGGHTLAQPQVLSRYHLLENGTLIIYETTLHDRGNYICRAQNSAGEAVLTVPLVVIAYQPRIITGPPPVLRARSGTPIQLNCAATGIPKPNIIWELPDRSLLSTAQQGRPTGSELLHPQGTLIIQRPTFADSGTYKCVAKNYLGTDSKVTYVHIGIMFMLLYVIKRNLVKLDILPHIFTYYSLLYDDDADLKHKENKECET
uniref:Ig-like domain-containing protein n=1 Tax=Cynoglossus semilaevis TaxID=244447 RepID=A0A3P8VGJ2_CYNSE